MEEGEHGSSREERERVGFGNKQNEFSACMKLSKNKFSQPKGNRHRLTLFLQLYQSFINPVIKYARETFII